MTIPTQANCPHSPEGWCLSCVEQLAAKVEELRTGQRDIAYASLEALMAQHKDWRVVDSEEAKDAARYRWLKAQHDSPHCSWHVRNGYTGLAAKNIPDDLDAEIDKAMSVEALNRSA